MGWGAGGGGISMTAEGTCGWLGGCFSYKMSRTVLWSSFVVMTVFRLSLVPTLVLFSSLVAALTFPSNISFANARAIGCSFPFLLIEFERYCWIV